MSTNIKAVGVAGSPGPDGSVPLRREVRELQSRFPDQWNLYMLGLEAFQGMDENNITSYYQIAGIHGMPYKPYNGVAGLPGASSGYCTHSSTIFLTWHRPYLSLYEQLLYAVIQDIASKFTGPNKAKYVAAAKDFRIPYYDWAALPSGLPSALTAATVSVIDRNGARQISNPLASFKFHPINPSPGDFSASWSRFPATARHPDSKGNSRNDQVASAISTMTAALRTSVVVALSLQNYNAFSNNRWLQNQRAGEYGSVENIHDALHDAIGGGGHMSALDASAFDPIFWQHHCNVDRLWAIWGALNPNSYVEPGAVGRDSFIAKRGTIEDINTQLKPFWDGSGTRFWNSAGVKETTTFNYAYPETQKWKFANIADYRRSVRGTVAQLYGTGNVVRDFIASGAINSLPTTNLFATQKAVALGRTVVDRSLQDATPAVDRNLQDTTPAVDRSLQDATPAVDRSLQDTTPTVDRSLQDTTPTVDRSLQDATPTVDRSLQDTTPTVDRSLQDATPTVDRSLQDATPTVDRSLQDTTPAGEAQFPMIQVDNDIGPDTPTLPSALAELATANTYTEYITNLRAEKHGLNQTFTVYVFLGDFNPDPQTWPFEYNTVGRFTLLGRASDTPCSKCADDAADGLIVTGTVPLTSALLQDIVAERLGFWDLMGLRFNGTTSQV
ncbi:tyrosinase precursor [Venturia nashicola]|nr:tyrosinase precursor [Venturia nashicola]